MPSRLTWSLILAWGAPIGLSAQQAPPSTDVWLVRWGGKAGDARNLTDRPGYDNQPSFSPDGRWVLYSSARDGQTEIYRYDVAQHVTMPLTATAESEYSPQVMPDGLAFSVVRVEADSSQRLWAFSMNGRTAVPLLADTKPVGYHAWADSFDRGALCAGESVHSPGGGRAEGHGRDGHRPDRPRPEEGPGSPSRELRRPVRLGPVGHPHPRSCHPEHDGGGPDSARPGGLCLGGPRVHCSWRPGPSCTSGTSAS